jgi:class 3 adenylate cyclase
VLLADLCSFSSYIRDTGDAEVVRESLTAFYSKARYQIINNGGMLYQFAGDEVIGLFGIPDHPDTFTDAVLDTARALCRIGESVTQHWQRRIDRMQIAAGLHVGVALGDLQIVSLRPFSRLHVGAIGDCINVASRLLGLAGPGEVVLSNAFHQKLEKHDTNHFLRLGAAMHWCRSSIKSSGSISRPTIKETGTHAAPQTKPIPAARQMRISHFFMRASQRN